MAIDVPQQATGGFDGPAPAEASAGDFDDAAVGSPFGEGPVGDAEAGGAEEQSPEQATADWLAGLDSDTRTYLEGKGLRDPAALARSYREAEAEMHRQRQANEALERQLTEGLDDGPQGPQGHAGGAQDVNVAEAVQQAAAGIYRELELGRIDEAQALQHMGALMANGMAAQQQQFLGLLDQRLSEFGQEHVQPLHHASWEEHWRREAAGLLDTYGQDDYRALAPRAKQIFDDTVRVDPGFTRNRHAFQLSFARALAERELTSRRERAAKTLNGGGRGPGAKQVDPAEAIWKEMQAITGAGVNGGLA